MTLMMIDGQGGPHVPVRSVGQGCRKESPGALVSPAPISGYYVVASPMGILQFAASGVLLTAMAATEWKDSEA